MERLQTGVTKRYGITATFISPPTISANIDQWVKVKKELFP